MISLETNYNLDLNKVLDEYPRPQLKRDSFINLNGKWDFKIFKDDDLFNNFNEKIVVPFPVESSLSGIERRVEIDERMGYRKVFTLNRAFIKDTVYLHFGAVDQVCDVYLNREFVCHHEGGYLPFKVNITKELKDENELIVIALDTLDTKYPTGKQKKNNGGIWYTPVSGIWQTVWLESVPTNHIEDVKFKPDIDSNAINIEIKANKPCQNKNIKVLYQDKIISEVNTNLDQINITLDDVHLWSPDDPNLYDVIITLDNDIVYSYFGMRKFSYVMRNNRKVMALNNKPFFFHGLLDQGWYPDGLYTVKSYDVYRDELKTLKKLGFNTLRKHIKIEPLIWYYLCDKMGIVVWQDMVNVGEYSFIKDSVMPILGKRDSKLFGNKVFNDAKENFVKAMDETVSVLYNSPSIALWTIFNEGWGEFDPKEMNEKLKTLDNTRFIDSASGWFYKEDENDLESHHIYFTKIDFNKKPLKKAQKNDKPIIISECGGFIYRVPGHIFKEDKEFGYKKFTTLDEYNNAFLHLYENEIISNLDKGLSGSIYTQVSDVEEELNGLFTYDRKVLKLNKDIALTIKRKIDEYYENK